MKMAHVNVITDPKQRYEQCLRKELNILDTLERGHYRCDTEEIYFWKKMFSTSVCFFNICFNFNVVN